MTVDLDAVRQHYAIGAAIVVQLRDGQSVSGRLQAVETDSLALATPTGPMHLHADVVYLIRMAGGPPDPAAWDGLIRQFEPLNGPPTLPDPSFKRDPTYELTDAAAVDRELNRIASQYSYAQKVREPRRIIPAIRILAELGEKYGYPPALKTAAILVVSFGSGEATADQAERWLVRAISLHGPFALDLAALRIHRRRLPEAHQGLAKAIRQRPPLRADDPLLRALLWITFETGDRESTVGALRVAAVSGGEARRVAVRAGLYLLLRLLPERAGPPMARIARLAEPTEHDVAQVWRALSTAPSETVAEPAVQPAPPPAQPARPRPPRAVAQPRQPHRDPGPAEAASILDAEARLHIVAAQHKLGQGYFAAALQIAERGLDLYPEDRGLKAIAEEASRLIKAGARQAHAGTAAPGRGGARRKTSQAGGLYSRAQHTETELKDLVQAESLYRRAIEVDDSTERSIRSLAWLLHRLGRSEEALALLRDRSHVIHEWLPHDNVIISILGDLGRWQESAEQLQKTLKKRPPRNTEVGLLKRLIVAYQKTRDWPNAKSAADRLIRIDPAEPEYRTIADALERAERTGIVGQLDVLLEVTEFNLEASRSISPVLSYHLDTCEYAGVKPGRIKRARLSESDVDDLDGLVVHLGVRRPGDRAAYNLSAARILRDLGLTEDDRYRRTLRAFAASMGDLCIVDRRPGDVTRTYYADAISLGRGGLDDMGNFKTRQYIMSYGDYRGMVEDGVPGSIERCLISMVEVRPRQRPLLVGLLTLATVSEVVGKEIIRVTHRDKGLRAVFYAQLCAYTDTEPETPITASVYHQAWQVALRGHRRGTDAQRQSLRLVLNRDNPMGTLTENQEELRRACALPVTTSLDAERLEATATLLGDIHAYLEQSSYLEQERQESVIRGALRHRIADIQRNPTQLSLEYLVPLLEKHVAALADHFAEVQRVAEPRRLVADIMELSYTPGPDSTIEVQLSVDNEARRSPASDVVLRIHHNREDYQPVRDPIMVAPSLRDGQSVACSFPLVVTPKAIRDQVLTLVFGLEFTVRSGERVVTEPESVSVRLYDANLWTQIVNPYAEGPPVKDERMFYGRGPLIEVLLDSLAKPDAKSIVIYGQKRVGKSSVLYQLERRLQPPLVAASFSLLELATSLNQRSLLYKIARVFHSRFERLADEGLPELGVAEPRLNDFMTTEAPQVHFDEYLGSIRRAMKRTTEYRDWRLVLLVDEFTMLYAAIEKGDLSRGFMQSWKAMLESELFSSVVVGNDLMPGFLLAYPNEFQVARQERVNYLDVADAQALITDPVLMDGAGSRYRGNAVELILALTARNPYYIQMLCGRLIEHMNRKQQPLIGPADVEQVATNLISGDHALGRDQFDNLLTPGDPDVSQFSDQDVLEVLLASLEGRRGDVHLNGHRAGSLPKGREVLVDLVRRDVIVRETDDRFRIRVGLFAEWLLSRRGATL